MDTTFVFNEPLGDLENERFFKTYYKVFDELLNGYKYNILFRELACLDVIH